MSFTNQHCNYFIVFPDDEHKNFDEWKKADERVSGFDCSFDLKRAISMAIVLAKETRVTFLVQPRNKAAVFIDGAVNTYIIKPSTNSVRSIIN